MWPKGNGFELYSACNNGYIIQMSCFHSMLEDTGDIQLNYWKHVMEVLLPSLGPCEGGLRGCIEGVLAHVKVFLLLFSIKCQILSCSFHENVVLQHNREKTIIYALEALSCGHSSRPLRLLTDNTCCLPY